MTKQQQCKVLERDHAVPWLDIIEHELHTTLADKLADQVFGDIVDCAWNFHNTVPEELRQKKPGRQEAIEILDDASDVKSYVLITCDENRGADMHLTGTGKEIMALLVSGSAQFIRHAGDDAPDRMKAGVVRMFKTDFINCLKTVLEDDDD